MLRLALEADGHTTQSAVDGPDALEKWGDGRTFDLVLLDQRMPSMEGVEVLRVLKERDAHAKVIMLTAFGTVDLALQAGRAGASDFLRKPFTADVLRSAVAAALAKDAHLASAGKLESDGKGGASGATVNGFRLRAAQTAPGHSPDGFTHRFLLDSPDDTSVACEVVFTPVFVELVKAHADRDVWSENERFWLWLGEEALANFLWQNSAPPLQNRLVLEELSPSLRRWMDALGSG